MIRHLRIVLIFALAACAFRSWASDIVDITIRSKDLVYSPLTRQLYVSVPSDDKLHPNTVTAIDPVTHRIGFSFRIPGNPSKLALSENGRMLYVAFENATSIQRLDLVAHTASPPFSLGADAHVDDMAVLPGHPESIAIARRGGIVIYDNGQPRPNVRGQGDRLLFAASSGILYSCNYRGSRLFKNRVEATGITETEDLPVTIPFTYEIKLDADRLYTVSGRQIDLKAERVVVDLPWMHSWNDSVAPDALGHRVFFLSGNLIQAFSEKTLALTGQLRVPGLHRFSSANCLTRWGKEGLAFRTDGGQVMLVMISALESSAIPPAAPGIPAGMVQLTPYRDGNYRYLVLQQGDAPPIGFEQAGFNDAVWKSGKAAFGNTPPGPGCPLAFTVQTPWPTLTDLVVRKRLLVPTAQSHLQIRIAVDNRVMQLFFNGKEIPVRIAATSCAELDQFSVDVPASLVQAGENLVVVHARDDGVESFFDMRVLARQPATAEQPALAGIWNLPLKEVRFGDKYGLHASIRGGFLLQNKSSQSTPAARVQFFLADSADPSGHRLLLHQDRVPMLSPNAFYALPIDFPLLHAVSARNKFIVAVIAPAASRFSDNATQYTMVTGPLPNSSGPTLYLSWEPLAQTWRPGGSHAGMTIKSALVIRNVGDQAAPAIAFTVFLAQGRGLASGDMPLRKLTMPVLQAGKIQRLPLEVNLPVNPKPFGRFLIAKPLVNQMELAQEDRWSSPSVGPILTPAHLIGSWGLIRQTIESAGSPPRYVLEAAFTLTNKGPEASPRYGLTFYLAPGRIASPPAILLERVLAPPLRPGEQITLKLQWHLPPGTIATRRYLLALTNTTLTVQDAGLSDRTIAVGPLP